MLRSLCLALAILWSLHPALAQRLSPLAPAPNWQRLEPYQETITRGEFQRLLETVYAPQGAWQEFIEVRTDSAIIKTKLQPAEAMALRFAADDAVRRPAPARAWRLPATELPPAPAGKPLAGVKIALDAGHLGGRWARMEERYFQIGESKPVQEGDLTLQVAQLLVGQLRALGAEVQLVRASLDPVTLSRPEELKAAAEEQIKQLGALTGDVQRESELLFYRISEIRERARLVNEQLKPDLTICLHFNAEAWGDPQRPEFVPNNHVHFLVNGCYSAGELRNDDLRFEMLHRLLERYLPEEQAASEALAASFSRHTGLPAYVYTKPIATPLGSSGFVYARNLLANRLYHSPVLFLEPYVMNSEAVWARVQAGDYEGELLLGGKRRRSLVREYAQAVTDGLREHYSKVRPVAPATP